VARLQSRSDDLVDVIDTLATEIDMKNLSFALLALVVASACSSNSAQPPTAPTTATTSSAATATVSSVPITVGEAVTATLALHGAQNVYTLVAPTDGTLVAQLSWSVMQGSLALDLGDAFFQNYPDNLSPVVGRLPVAAGMTYRITVADDAPWDYGDFSAHYVLTTVIE
jgi:hypothetical protein